MSSNIPLLGRVCSVEVDGSLIDGLRIAFSVQKDIQKEPNRATIKVYNLAETTRHRLQRGNAQFLRLRAGFEQVVEDVFLGDITRVQSYREETEWVTEFSAGDGVKAHREKRNKLSRRNVEHAELLENLVDEMGKGKGNLVAAVKKLREAGQLPAMIKKWADAGSLTDQLEQVSKEMGLQFTIQDNAPAFVKLGAIVDPTVVVLSPGSGLLGSPELTKKGYVKAKALIQQRLVPGRGVKIDSAQLRGLYQIHKTKYEGDSRGDPWHADLELVQVVN
jgi:hypothetical protein